MINAHNQGMIIFTIGATDSMDVQELAEMASSLSGFNFSAIENAVKYTISGSVENV